MKIISIIFVLIITCLYYGCVYQDNVLRNQKIYLEVNERSRLELLLKSGSILEKKITNKRIVEVKVERLKGVATMLLGKIKLAESDPLDYKLIQIIDPDNIPKQYSINDLSKKEFYLIDSLKIYIVK